MTQVRFFNLMTQVRMLFYFSTVQFYILILHRIKKIFICDAFFEKDLNEMNGKIITA